MKNFRLASALLVSVFFILAACEKRGDAPAQTAANTPHSAVMVAVNAMKSGDFLAFLKNAMSEAEYQEAREEWEKARAEALDPEEEAELNDTLALIRKDDAVDVIMSEIEPQLKEVQGQLPLLLGIAQTVGHAGIANSDDLTDEQKTAANELLGAMGRWAGGRDLADPALARKAVSIAVEAGRNLNLESASDLRALEFEEMIQRGSLLFKASKKMLLVYGLDADGMLNSVTAETLSEEGDRALVRVRFQFLDTEQKIDVPMLRRNGRWYSEDSLGDDQDEESVNEEQT